MKILAKGTRHIAHKVRVSCLYCGTRVELIQGERNTDIKITYDLESVYRVDHIFYTCPVCNERIVASTSKENSLMNVEIEPNATLTKEEVRELYYPDQE